MFRLFYVRLFVQTKVDPIVFLCWPIVPFVASPWPELWMSLLIGTRLFLHWYYINHKSYKTFPAKGMLAFSTIRGVLSYFWYNVIFIFRHVGCMLHFWKGKSDKAPYDEVVNLYWSISRAPRQWPGETEAIAFVAAVWSIRPEFVFPGCTFNLGCKAFWLAPRDKKIIDKREGPQISAR